jgi:hypothetical protein
MKMAANSSLQHSSKGNGMDVEYLQEVSNAMMTRFDLIARQCTTFL